MGRPFFTVFTNSLTLQLVVAQEKRSARSTGTVHGDHFLVAQDEALALADTRALDRYRVVLRARTSNDRSTNWYSHHRGDIG